MGELSKLPNIGKVVEKQLNEVGIEIQKQLIKIGIKQAWLNIKTIDSSSCYNKLCGLEGAIQCIRWHSLSSETKLDLKEFYTSFK